MKGKKKLSLISFLENVWNFGKKVSMDSWNHWFWKEFTCTCDIIFFNLNGISFFANFFQIHFVDTSLINPTNHLTYVSGLLNFIFIKIGYKTAIIVWKMFKITVKCQYSIEKGLITPRPDRFEWNVRYHEGDPSNPKVDLLRTPNDWKLKSFTVEIWGKSSKM